MRTMYDPASQVTFITRHALDKVQHKVLNCNYTIKINGFNESKIINSNIVEISWVLHNKRKSFKLWLFLKLRLKQVALIFSILQKCLVRIKLL